MSRAIRRPGIDLPHVALCVRCKRVHEWYGLRSEGGKDVAEGFVCSTCLWPQQKPVTAPGEVAR